MVLLYCRPGLTLDSALQTAAAWKQILNSDWLARRWEAVSHSPDAWEAAEVVQNFYWLMLHHG